MSIDPGLSTGLAVGHYTEDTPLKITGRQQFAGGLQGFLEWQGGDIWDLADGSVLVISEKFTPRPNEKFNLTLKSVEPLRIEGALVAMGMMPDYPDPRWRSPAAQYFSGGANLTERKKKSRQFLKDHDLYITGKDVGQKDADDAISATLHLIAYMRHINHLPTLKHYFGGADD